MTDFQVHHYPTMDPSFKNKRLAFDKNKQPNRWYYEMDLLGFNYRMTDIQAALGMSQLTKINIFTKKRKQIAKIYNKNFYNVKYLKTPFESKNIIHTYHLYTILIDFKKINLTKNRFMKYLHENGIGSQVLYIPVFLQPYYKRKYNYKPSKFPVSMKYYEEALSIPIFYSLTFREQVKVIKKIKEILIN